MDPRRADLETEALHQIARVLSLSTDLSKGFTSSLNILAQYLGMENGTLSLFDPVTGEVFIEAAPEMNDDERILGRLRPGEGVVGRIFASGVPVVIPDIATEPLFLDRTGSWRDLEDDPRALVGVPVQDGRAVLGVLTVDRPHRNGPPAFGRDLSFLGTVAHLLAARVRLMQLENPHRRASRDVPGVMPDPERFPGVVGASAKMREVLALVARVAPSRATVFLRGDSGTGKEVVARALHDASPRAERSFVAVNCAAIPEALIESELFGHEKGAFTGASGARQGRFEQADGGTLFLDEVGDLSLAAQAKLLRAVQERQFERVGGSRTVTVDVRLVAATNRPLEQMIRSGAFRLDLYHRLSVVTLTLPPLRDRPEDVPALARHFLRQLGEENGRDLELAPETLELLAGCRWSGNARQLRNCLERAVVVAEGRLLGPGDFGCRLGGSSCSCTLEDLAEPPGQSEAAPPPSLPARAPATERDRVVAALDRSGWVQAKAARLLGMTARQLAYRVRKYAIPLERF